MNPKSVSQAVGFFAAVALAAVPTAAEEESNEDLVNRLRGQAGKQEAPQFKTRGIGGLNTRGINTQAPAPEIKKETRTVTFTRGIPTSIKVAEGDGTVEVKETTEEVSAEYEVDPESKVTRDNILFKQGSAEFADSSSIGVIIKLATALADDELADFKYAVEGHASAEGSADSNQSLSQLRAEKIVDVLCDYQVDRDRLLPVGFGESKARFPDTASEAQLSQDRRVVIFRIAD